MWGFPGDSVVKNLLANVEDIWDAGSIPGSGRSARAEILIVFLSGKSQVQRSMASYSPWVTKSGTELSTHAKQIIYTYTYIYTHIYTHTHLFVKIFRLPLSIKKQDANHVYILLWCVYWWEGDTNTHTFKCKCLNKLCMDKQETGNACFWEGNG